MNLERVRTLGELKKTNYLPKPIKEEIRDNLITALRARKEVFEGIQGYDE